MYSVDKKFVGKRIKIIGDDKNVSIFYNTILIAKHEVKDQKINYLPEHYSSFLRSKGMDDNLAEEYAKITLERFKNI